MMRQRVRAALWLVLSSMLGSLLAIVSTETAGAVESIPTLQWPAVDVGRRDSDLVVSPTGSVTAPCTTYGSGSDLVTYSSSGQLIRQIDRTSYIDGVQNCLNVPVVDKNDVLYGIPWGKNASGSYVYGPNLLAYSGSTLKWKYPLTCGVGKTPTVTVGADGRIYATGWFSDGAHLIGLTPDVQPPLTGPAKVFDVKIPNDCSVRLEPYRDGIAIHSASYGNSRYFSYGGKYLGQAAIGDMAYEQFNADGQLFVANWTSTTPRSVSVSMYDPRKGAVSWTTPASTAGADVYSIYLAPLASGGVLATIREQKMDSPGVPSVPKEYVYTLVTLSAVGQKIQSVTLPNSDSYGRTFSNTFSRADTTGKVIVTREVSIPTQVSWPATVAGIAIGVYDPLNAIWGYQTLMKGNTDPPASPSGYYLDRYDGNKAAAPVSNTIYMMAHCYNSCTNYNPMLYPIQVPGIGIDYPRGAVLAANTGPQPAPVPYVALGDSYSSGEGVAPFDSVTDTSTNKCHRSQFAYSQVLSHDPSMAADLNLGGFWACSGAKTENIKEVTFNGEAAQYTRLNGNTKLVTATIGGNDMGFTPFGLACVFEVCKIGTSAYNTAKNNIDTMLPGALTSTYIKILTYAPNAHIYIPDYPQVAPEKTVDDPVDPRCDWLYWDVAPDGTRIPGQWKDAQAARDIVSRLNAAIHDAVETVRQMNPDYATRLHYVPVNGPGSPFIGHTVCSAPGESYFNNLDTAIGHESWVLHPNERGQQAYAQILKEAMNQ